MQAAVNAEMQVAAKTETAEAEDTGGSEDNRLKMGCAG